MDSRFFSFAENFDGRRVDAEELRRCMPVNVTTSYKVLAPALWQAEEEYVKPVLGVKLFDELALFYAERSNDGHDGSGMREDVMAGLLELVQMADVRLAMWDSYDQLKVNIGESGAVPVVDDNRRLYRYEEDALRRSLESQGQRALDEVAKYCESHVDVLESFKESEYWTVLTTSLVPDRVTFDKMVPINKSALLFNRLRVFIDETEEMELGYRLGESLRGLFYGVERESVRVVRLMQYVRQFVAHWSYANACVGLNVIPTEMGLMKTEESASSSGRGTGRVMNGAGQDRIASVIQHERDRAERYMAMMLDYVKAHIEDYPEAEAIGGEKLEVNQSMKRDNRKKRMFVC